MLYTVVFALSLALTILAMRRLRRLELARQAADAVVALPARFLAWTTFGWVWKGSAYLDSPEFWEVAIWIMWPVAAVVLWAMLAAWARLRAGR